ncbi:MAG: hypothetical protein A2096_04060 [Spirochaetes bacterium GWF1_41_5]|nr:MAG: hypothetical protein A2096_04060 [Spirochaetes bacterium GWF1_41_5]
MKHTSDQHLLSIVESALENKDNSFAVDLLEKSLNTERGKLRRIQQNNKWGYCDKKKNIIISCQYDQAEPFYCARAIVSINKQKGLIDNRGQIIIPFIYDNIGFAYSPGLYMVEKNKKWGVANRKGIILAPCLNLFCDEKEFFDGKITSFYRKDWSLAGNGNYEIAIFSERSGMSIYEKNNLYGILDKKNRQVTDAKYDAIEFADKKSTLFLCKLKNKKFNLDKNGHKVIAPGKNHPKYILRDKQVLII